jgi:hypothetical protein
MCRVLTSGHERKQGPLRRTNGSLKSSIAPRRLVKETSRVNGSAPSGEHRRLRRCQLSPIFAAEPRI